MDNASSVPWNIVAAVVGAALSLVGVLIVLNLRSIKNCLKKLDVRIDKHDANIKSVETDVVSCKIECSRTFVSSESFLRETGFARRSLETLTASVNNLAGKLTVVERLPQICGDISREIVRQMQNGGKNG